MRRAGLSAIAEFLVSFILFYAPSTIKSPPITHDRRYSHSIRSSALVHGVSSVIRKDKQTVCQLQRSAFCTSCWRCSVESLIGHSSPFLHSLSRIYKALILARLRFLMLSTLTGCLSSQLTNLTSKSKSVTLVCSIDFIPRLGPLVAFRMTK